jgi:hypothetical protein
MPPFVPATCFDAKGVESPYTGRGVDWCPVVDGDFPGVPSCPGGYFFVPLANACFLSEADIPKPPAMDPSADVLPCMCATGRDERNERGGCTWTNPVRERMGIDGIDVACICPQGYTHTTETGVMDGEPCARMDAVADAGADASVPEVPTKPLAVPVDGGAR